jgi:acylglycerol lipase
MKHQEGFFKGVRGSNNYYQYWVPEDNPKASLVICHGVAEHSGRYMNVVNHFVPLGYAVYGFDHVGHGKSDGARVHVKRFEDYAETLKVYCDMVNEWQPGTPIYLIGHSLGGAISALYLFDHQEEVAGAVLSGPAVKVPDNISPATIFIGKILSVLVPRIGLVGLDAEGVSRDPEVVQAYVNDPLVYTGKMTARFGAEYLKTMKHISAEASKITLPILILQGGADKLVDPEGAKMLYAAVGSPDKTIKIYEELYHEIFNEPEHVQVLSDVEAWLNDHLDS